MKIIVFAGPSLGELPRSRDGDIVWLPPAAQGSILSAVHRMEPDVVVIADVMTWPSMSVLHKEIIWALSRGTRVIGAAAGGALRAAELSFCGMKGCGRVYDAVAAGVLEDDAEVFCAWEQTPAGYRRLTEPLVNIRATLDDLRVKQILTQTERDALLRAAEQIHYEDRTVPALLDALAADEISRPAAGSTIDCFRAHYVDVQRDDLRETMNRIGEPGFLPEPLSPESMCIPIDEHGAIFRMLYDHDRIVEQDDIAMRLYEIGNYVTTHHEDIETVAGNAFNRQLVLFLAEQVALPISNSEIASCARKFRSKSGLTEDETLRKWLAENDLSREDFSNLMREEALIGKLQAAFMAGQMFQKNTRPLLDYMRLTQKYAPWREEAFDREKTLLGHRERLHQEYLSTDFGKLLAIKQKTDPLPWSGEIQSAADALGIGARELKIELLKDRLRDTVLLEQMANSLA